VPVSVRYVCHLYFLQEVYFVYWCLCWVRAGEIDPTLIPLNVEACVCLTGGVGF
jgi:hypothetical protein